jgi:chromatin remodeling complex protein RSC6
MLFIYLNKCIIIQQKSTMDNLELEQKAEAWVRAVKKAEEKIKREEEERNPKQFNKQFAVPASAKALAAKARETSERQRNRPLSGFVKPRLISSELASFLGKTAGTEMARTEVTREINAYIREHQLQDKSNGRIINADSKLSSLLKLKAGEELTYFNLQRYMRPHFLK